MVYNTETTVRIMRVKEEGEEREGRKEERKIGLREYDYENIVHKERK